MLDRAHTTPADGHGKSQRGQGEGESDHPPLPTRPREIDGTQEQHGDRKGPDRRRTTQPLRGGNSRRANDCRPAMTMNQNGHPLCLKDLTAAAVRGLVAARPWLIIPVGTLEGHAPHLPLGVIGALVERLADDLSARFRVVRSPLISFGVNRPDTFMPSGFGRAPAQDVAPGHERTYRLVGSVGRDRGVRHPLGPGLRSPS